MKNKLTIIIPCYNCDETLEEAVDSIYIQNIDIPFEIIMVDDGSTDNTTDVMTRLSKKYSEIEIFQHSENKGGGATRNTAVANSTGDIIFCLDSDDLLPVNTLPKMYRYLQEKNCDGVTFHKSIKFKGTNKEDVDYVDISSFINERIPFESQFSKEIKFNPVSVNFMYTRKAFDLLGGYPTNHGFDTQGFGFRFLCSNLTAYTCPDTEYLHRINFKESYYLRDYNNGRINYNWREILLEYYYIFNEKTLDFIKKFDCSDFTRNIMDELKKMDNILINNVQEELNKKHPKSKYEFKIKSIKRNSVKGYYFRLKSRIRKIIN